MVNRYSFKNKIFRAGFYVVSIGGLMLLFSGVLWLCWNRLLVERYQYGGLSLLESIGLVSIAYVVFSAIRFSSVEDCDHAHNAPTLQSETLSHNEVEHQKGQIQRATTVPEDLDAMQREQLKREIERCCGKQHMHKTTPGGLDASLQ